MFRSVLITPLYNLLVLLSTKVPGFDLGWGIITLTLIVKVILLPFYHQSLVTQVKLKKLDPLIRKIKEESKGDKTQETTKLLALYKENKINPIIGFVLLLVQLPIILALFYVFKDSVSLQGVGHIFLGWFDLTSRSYVLAVLTGLTQFFQIKLSLPPQPPKTDGARSFQEDLARNMQWQMKYFMPVMITVVAAGLPAALALYWITSSLFAIAYELLIRRRLLAANTN